MNDKPYDELLDVKGLRCPMPMLKTKKALSKMEPGQKLCILATDPHAQRDLSQFAEQTGNNLLSSEKQGEVFCFIFQRKST